MSITDDYDAGLPLKVIAARANITLRTLSRKLRGMKLCGVLPLERKALHSALRPLIADDYQAGLPLKVIAADRGCSIKTVEKVARQLGLRRRC